MSAVPPVTPPNPSTVAEIEAALETFAAKAKTEESKIWTKIWTWIKTNVVHLAGYSTIVAALKHWL